MCLSINEKFLRNFSALIYIVISALLLDKIFPFFLTKSLPKESSIHAEDRGWDHGRVKIPKNQVIKEGKSKEKLPKQRIDLRLWMVLGYFLPFSYLPL